MDKRKLNGGHSTKSTSPTDKRKLKKAEIMDLRNQLKAMEVDALEKLHEGIVAGDFRHLKLYMEYQYGKPRETKDITVNEVPTIDLNDWK